MSLATLLFGLLMLTGHQGIVSINGVPIPGATVTFSKGDQSLVTITDANGGYAVPDLPDGTWTVQVEMLGFATAKQDITPAPNAPATEWELKLLPMDQIHAEVAKTPAPATTSRAATGTQQAQGGFQRADVRET